jgi:DNA repair exonuclease SbcCD ATPase subunit
MQEHMEKCRQDTQNQIKEINEKLQKIASETKNLKTQLLENKKQIKHAQECNDKLRSIASRISSIASEMNQKKQLFEEYKEMLSNEEISNNQLKDNFEQISAKLAQSETDNILEIRKKVKEENDKINVLKLDIKKIENDLMEEQKTKAIILSKIKEAEALEEKKKSIEVEIKSKSKYSKAYPYVVQALSSSGIPNIIIQNMLEDLQSEVNELLPDLHPGLQLTFSTEKTKSDGTVDDTLDIVYYLNSKERDFEQLSGAQKLAATFGLKLGLAFFLKKNLGMELNLLLLDEIDQSLDKAGVDAFANIVKRFEDEFTILVITHNDRLKDKFSHAILVEQDYDRVSKAKVISI